MGSKKNIGGIPEIFRLRLKKARDRLDWSQGGLAKRAGIPTQQSAVAGWESGTEPGVFKAARLADAMGVSLDWLTGLSDLVVTSAASSSLAEDEAAVLLIYRTLRDHQGLDANEAIARLASGRSAIVSVSEHGPIHPAPPAPVSPENADDNHPREAKPKHRNV